MCFFVFCFFFQAEDGIRDKLVTGVQTCALPILVPIGGDVREYQVEADPLALAQRGITIDELVEALERSSRSSAAGFHVDRGRSEERRVGKECRSRWVP